MSSYSIAEQERINFKAAKERLDHIYVGNPPPASDHYATLLYYGSPVEQYGYDDPIVKPQTFNPYDVGVGSYLRNVWGIALERAKQENTTPKMYEYAKPIATGSGGNSGMGGVVGWFTGIPQYFQNLREQDKIDWVNYKQDLEDRKNRNKNPEGQEVISDSDTNDPLITFAGASGSPSGDVSVPEKINNTWDDFMSGVKSGWETGGLTDYKTPLMIAGGVLLLILIIK